MCGAGQCWLLVSSGSCLTTARKLRSTGLTESCVVVLQVGKRAGGAWRRQPPFLLAGGYARRRVLDDVTKCQAP